MLSRRLKRKGYEVVMAVDGQEGVYMATSESPAVIFGYESPVMDDWEAARQFKANPDTKGIAIRGLSAHAMTTDRDKAIAAGCDDYDTKPLGIKCFLGRIQDLLETSDAG
jgi:CheY-like chemotaxis protein